MFARYAKYNCYYTKFVIENYTNRFARYAKYNYYYTDITAQEYQCYIKQNCEARGSCVKNCPIYYVNCSTNDANCWVFHKEIYSDDFLNKEIEIEPIIEYNTIEELWR